MNEYGLGHPVYSNLPRNVRRRELRAQRKAEEKNRREEEQVEALTGALEAQLSEQENGKPWDEGAVRIALANVVKNHLSLRELLRWR